MLDNPNIGVSMHHDQGELIKDGQPQKSVKSMYYYFASKVFAPEGNLKKLGIWNIHYVDELRSGWGMFTKSKLVNRENGESGDAQLLVTFAPESGRLPIKLVGEELILAFIYLQGLKIAMEGKDEETKLLKMLEDNLDDDIIINIGLKSGKPVTGSMTVAQYVSMWYVAGIDAVAGLSNRLMSEMCGGVASIRSNASPEKNSFRTRISTFGKKISSIFVKR